jgi:hypothetical protein
MGVGAPESDRLRTVVATHERDLALTFTLAGLIGIAVTGLARASRSFRRLSAGWWTAAAA